MKKQSGISNIKSLPNYSAGWQRRMSKEEAIEVMATVLETLPNAMFKVAVDDNSHEVLAHNFGQNAKEFYSHSAEGQIFGGAFTIRSKKRANNVSL